VTEYFSIGFDSFIDLKVILMKILIYGLLLLNEDFIIVFEDGNVYVGLITTKWYYGGGEQGSEKRASA
jgi:hypothetical protein